MFRAGPEKHFKASFYTYIILYVEDDVISRQYDRIINFSFLLEFIYYNSVLYIVNYIDTVLVDVRT